MKHAKSGGTWREYLIEFEELEPRCLPSAPAISTANGAASCTQDGNVISAPAPRGTLAGSPALHQHANYAVFDALSGANESPNSGARQIRILTLGDSITEGYGSFDQGRGVLAGAEHPWGGYRVQLFRDLEQWSSSARMRFSFVGPHIDGPGTIRLRGGRYVPFDGHNAGYEGFRIDQLDQSLSTIAAHLNDPPNLILLHVGTNDLHEGYHPDAAPHRLKLLIEHIQQHFPNAILMVASIIPVIGLDHRVSAYNQAIRRMIEADFPRVVYVPMNESLAAQNFESTPGDYRDDVHPRDFGYAKIGNVWFAAIQAIERRLRTP